MRDSERYYVLTNRHAVGAHHMNRSFIEEAIGGTQHLGTSRQQGDNQVPDVHVGRTTGAEQRLSGIRELTVAPFDRLRIAPVT